MKSRYAWAVVGKNRRVVKNAPDDSYEPSKPGELCIYAKRSEAEQMSCDDEKVVKVFIREIW